MTTKQKQQERETAVIRAPHDGSEVGVVALAGPEDVRAALDANVATARAARDMPAHARAAALRRIADGLEAARAEFARTLALEAGKPMAPKKPPGSAARCCPLTSCHPRPAGSASRAGSRSRRLRRLRRSTFRSYWLLTKSRPRSHAARRSRSNLHRRIR